MLQSQQHVKHLATVSQEMQSGGRVLLVLLTSLMVFMVLNFSAQHLLTTTKRRHILAYFTNTQRTLSAIEFYNDEVIGMAKANITSVTSGPFQTGAEIGHGDSGSYSLAHPLHWTPDWALSSDIGEMLEARKRRVIERLDKTVQLIH